MRKIKQTIRNILALKHIAAFNIIGLTIGMSSFIIISIWAYTHLSFDKNFPHHNDVYLVQESDIVSRESDLVVPFQISAYIRDKYPDIDHIAIYQYWPDKLKIKAGNKVFFEEITSSEKSIINILNFDFIASKPNLFDAAGDMAICESMAHKLFGTIDCIGNNIVIADSVNASIAAVYKDFPSNSTFKPSSLCLFDINENLFKPCNEWGSFCYYCLARINPKTKLAGLEQKLTAELQKDHELDINISFYPLNKVHLNHPGEETLLSHVVFVFFSGILVLIVSCLNFINLLSVSFAKRKKQMAVKGFLGATKFNYIMDYLVEIGLYLLVVFCLSLIISIQALPRLSETIHFNPLNLFGIGWFIMMHIAVALIIAVVISLYPLVFYGFRAGSNFTKSININSGKMRLGKAFVIFQFSITIVICIVAFVMQRQLNYASQKDKGYNPQDVIVAECWDYPLQKKKAAVSEFLSSNTDIKSFSFAGGGFNGLGSRTSGFNPIDADGNAKEVYKVMYKSDEKMFETMGVKLLAGRKFMPHQFNESNHIIINESFANQLGGVDSAMNLRLKSGKEYQVIGVCNDFIFENFYTKVEPLLIQYNTSSTYHLLIKANPDKQMKVLADVSAFLKSQSDAPFTVKPMALLLSEMYAQESNQQALISLFGLLTILVSCLGLLGLTFFIIENKTKEIGIRKVNGAKMSEILILLNKDFVIWVTIAFLIAGPIARYAMGKWLENFAYKIDLSWWIFASAGLLTVIISLITVSWQSSRAANQNPVNCLRYE